MPKKAELAVLEDAVAELKAFSEFTSVFGRTIPSIDILVAMFDGGAQWSSSRAKARAYDAYCHTQEGLVWLDLRKLMAKVRPVFEQAIATDPCEGRREAVSLRTPPQRAEADRRARRRHAQSQQGRACSWRAGDPRNGRPGEG